MLLRSGFNHCCEVVGRASAIIMLASMGSIVWRQPRLTFCASQTEPIVLSGRSDAWMCAMEKIVLLAALISAILAMAQFPDWPHQHPRASAEAGPSNDSFD